MIEILHASVSGLNQLFSGSTFGLMFLGILIGFAVGILPGLGGPTTFALMLPFIYKMQAVEAFAFLLGMASVVNTTGDITSILVGVPGEPGAAATIIDGHPMAKKGEAGRALGAALMSSLVGAIFGAFALALGVLIVRPLVLVFGSPEFFMLAILGLTFVASLSSGFLLKALIAGGIGLLLSTIGLDSQTAIRRFTFGQPFLWDGIGLIPISIGLFAIPEIIDLAVQGSSIAGERVGKLGGVMEGVKDTFRHFWMVIRCSAIGTYTAIIPGMGSTAQWMAYAHAVQSSPDKERFGKGAVEGVLGPGAANNSTFGGNILTTVSFGLPTNVGTALLLGAFIIQGLVPGPAMLIPEARGGHLSLTFSFVWTIVVSNFITVAISFLFLKQLVKVTQLRASLVIPIILLLVYLGAFAEKNVFGDVYLLVIFGILGWIMVRLKWPRPPLILGLVLGPLAENRLFVSINNYGLAWLLRPGVIFLIALSLAGALYPMFRSKYQKSKSIKNESPAATTTNCETTASKRLLWKFRWALLFNLFIVAVLTLALWESRRFNVRAGLFPWAIGFPVLAFAIVQFVIDFMGKGSKSNGHPEEEKMPELPADVANRRTAGMFGWIIGFFVGIWLLGFPIAIPLCTFLYLKRAREKWLLILILTGFTWAFVYGFFDHVLHIPFPTGKLFVWL